MNTNPRKRPCAYHNPKTGRSCRAWAVRSSNPPRCHAHRHSSPTQEQRLAVYADYNLQDVADLLDEVNEGPLDAEIANVRTVIGRLMSHLHQELSPAEFIRIVNLIFTGSATIAKLLRAQRALTGESADGLASAIAEVLEEMATEWGIEP